MSLHDAGEVGLGAGVRGLSELLLAEAVSSADRRELPRRRSMAARKRSRSCRVRRTRRSGRGSAARAELLPPASRPTSRTPRPPCESRSRGDYATRRQDPSTPERYPRSPGAWRPPNNIRAFVMASPPIPRRLQMHIHRMMYNSNTGEARPTSSHRQEESIATGERLRRSTRGPPKVDDSSTGDTRTTCPRRQGSPAPTAAPPTRRCPPTPRRPRRAAARSPPRAPPR